MFHVSLSIRINMTRPLHVYIYIYISSVMRHVQIGIMYYAYTRSEIDREYSAYSDVRVGYAPYYFLF
mgnify:CR=1 FL=1